MPGPMHEKGVSGKGPPGRAYGPDDNLPECALRCVFSSPACLTRRRTPALARPDCETRRSRCMATADPSRYGASLMYSRCVKNPVILPGKTYSAMNFGFTVASASIQNSFSAPFCATL